MSLAEYCPFFTKNTNIVSYVLIGNASNACKRFNSFVLLESKEINPGY